VCCSVPVALRALVLLPLLAAASSAVAQQPPPLATFSIVACDAEGGFHGVAIQSRVVGAGMIVPAAEGGVGALATQALANVAYKRQALELLRAGRSAAEVQTALIAGDPGSARRQFAVADAACGVAAFTGDSTIPWAGQRVGRNYSVQGNILTGQVVVDAMAAAFEAAEAAGRPFPERLLEALKAGQAAGGDRRGQQGAGLLVVRPGGGYGGGDDRYVDLRVEDHAAPILELERVYGIWMSLFHPGDHFLPRGPHGYTTPAGPHVCELSRLLARAGHGDGPGTASFCALDARVLGDLAAFQRAHRLPVTPAVTPELVSRIRAAARPE
jgi:uncharacterized Ntn-hydrolase superfamily protein